MRAARLWRKLGSAAGSWAVRLLAATLRLRRDERTVEPLLAAGAPVIYVVWHSRLLLLLARLTGAHVVPAALGASSEWRARSWDQFRIPKPFSRCVVRLGEPILVPRDIDGAREETARAEIEAALSAVTWQADEEARR